MVKENLLLDVKEFMSKAEKAWYASKGKHKDPRSCGADHQVYHIAEGM
jgi:hypothetical protein